jgi:hypothetical protein
VFAPNVTVCGAQGHFSVTSRLQVRRRAVRAVTHPGGAQPVFTRRGTSVPTAVLCAVVGSRPTSSDELGMTMTTLIQQGAR